jgi:hypothetical protein
VTDFHASPADIRDFGKLVGKQAGHADACQSHIFDHTGLQGGEGWLNMMSGAHDTLVADGRTWFADLSTYTLEAAERAILASADYYETTDTANAESYDAGLTGYETSPPVAQGSDARFHNQAVAQYGRFGEMVDPQESLTAPPDYAAEGSWRWEPTWADYISLASIGRGAILAATEILAHIGWMDRAYDPYELLLKPVIGDWAGFRGCVDVFRNVAEAARQIQTNLHHGRAGVPTVWTGNAADSCEFYLAEVCAVLPDAAGVLEEIAAEYERAAQGAKDFSSTIGSIISNLVDAAIVFAAAAAAGAATAATGVGLVVGGGVAVYEAYTIVRLVNESADIYQLTNDLMSAVQASLNDFGQLNASDAFLPKPPEVADDGSTMAQLP